MSLFGKLRTLIGALVHAPLAAGQERPHEEMKAGHPASGAAQDSAGLERPENAALDNSRVADLIARRRESGEP